MRRIESRAGGSLIADGFNGDTGSVLIQFDPETGAGCAAPPAPAPAESGLAPSGVASDGLVVAAAAFLLGAHRSCFDRGVLGVDLHESEASKPAWARPVSPTDCAAPLDPCQSTPQRAATRV